MTQNGIEDESAANLLIASEIRIKWAGEKLDQLELHIQRSIQGALKTPVAEYRDDRMKVMFDLLYDVVPEARRLISEYALHARSALDYIIYDLARHSISAEPENTHFLSASA